MGYLDTKETFTIDEILAHQSEIEQDFNVYLIQRMILNSFQKSNRSRKQILKLWQDTTSARCLKKTAPAFQMTVNSRK